MISIPRDTEQDVTEAEPGAVIEFSIPGDAETEVTKPLTGRRLEGIVTAAMLRRVGIGRLQFYRLLALAEKLCSEAQASAQQAGLTEKQLRPVVKLTDQVQQAACVQAIIAHNLTSEQVAVLVEAVRAGADPHAAAARLAGVSAPAMPAKKPAPARPQPPAHLSRPGRALWQDLRRASAAWEWALDPGQAEQRVSALSDLDRETLWGLAAMVRAALDEFVARLGRGEAHPPPEA